MGSSSSSRKRKKIRSIRIVRSPCGPTHRGILIAGNTILRCSLGKAAISTRKREGDGATPAGRHRILGGYCHRRYARISASWLKPVRPDLGWCDDPNDGNYNRPVRIPCGAGHEKMARDDGLYDFCLVLDWNARPRIRNGGSAIFLHITTADMGPTRGCVGLERADLERLLPLVGPGTAINIFP